MKVRLLKDWSYHKTGDTVDVWEATGRNWILNGIAEPPPPDRRSVDVEDTRSSEPADVERAERRPRRK
jgi:hypothetical protein